MTLVFLTSCDAHDVVDPTPKSTLGESCIFVDCEEGLTCIDYTGTCAAPCESSRQCDEIVEGWGNCWQFPEEESGQCLPECRTDEECSEGCSCEWLSGFPPRYGCICE